MTVKELIKAIQAKAEQQTGKKPSRKQTNAIMRAFFAVASETLQEGDSITLPRIGALEPVSRKARAGRHPQTREIINISASKSVRFRLSRAMRKTLNP